MEGCRDAKNKINLNDFTIKINRHKNKRRYGMLASWNEKKLKNIKKQKRQDIL